MLPLAESKSWWMSILIPTTTSHRLPFCHKEDPISLSEPLRVVSNYGMSKLKGMLVSLELPSLYTIILWSFIHLLLYFITLGRQVRSLGGHSSRIGALAWNNHMLTSGSRDNSIINHDVRIQNHIIGKMVHHTQEVCGLAWSPDGTYLASGANDNMLCITEAASFNSMVRWWYCDV